MKKIITVIAVILSLAMVFCACGKTETFTTSDDGKNTVADGANEKAASEADDVILPEGEHPQVLFTMKDGQTFTIELCPEYAPKTCENFLKLVGEGFYDGLTFHRIRDGFMAQGGDPQGNGYGGSDETIPGEFAANGFTQNTLSHQRGVVSMARGGYDMNSASSQFFICYGDESFLDGNYAAFGRVIDGMETIDSFLKVERVDVGEGVPTKPVTPIVIQSAVILDVSEDA